MSLGKNYIVYRPSTGMSVLIEGVLLRSLISKGSPVLCIDVGRSLEEVCSYLGGEFNVASKSFNLVLKKELTVYELEEVQGSDKLMEELIVKLQVFLSTHPHLHLIILEPRKYPIGFMKWLCSDNCVHDLFVSVYQKDTELLNLFNHNDFRKMVTPLSYT